MSSRRHPRALAVEKTPSVRLMTTEMKSDCQGMRMTLVKQRMGNS